MISPNECGLRPAAPSSPAVKVRPVSEMAVRGRAEQYSVACGGQLMG
jgi:hypothetical protein